MTDQDWGTADQCPLCGGSLGETSQATTTVCEGGFVSTSRYAWTIPVAVAERALIVTGPAAVVRGVAYVGPLRTLFGLAWGLCGGRTVEC